MALDDKLESGKSAQSIGEIVEIVELVADASPAPVVVDEDEGAEPTVIKGAVVVGAPRLESVDVVVEPWFVSAEHNGAGIAATIPTSRDSVI